MEQRRITNPLIWIWTLRISNPMNPFSKRIHQIKNPDLDLPKGMRNPFLDRKSVFGFTERNTPLVFRTRLENSIDLFHNGGLLTYSFIYMIISLSNLVSMCKIQRKTFFRTRSERLIIIHVKEYINRPPL